MHRFETWYLLIFRCIQTLILCIIYSKCKLYFRTKKNIWSILFLFDKNRELQFYTLPNEKLEFLCWRRNFSISENEQRWWKTRRDNWISILVLESRVFLYTFEGLWSIYFVSNAISKGTLWEVLLTRDDP